MEAKSLNIEPAKDFKHLTSLKNEKKIDVKNIDFLSLILEKLSPKPNKNVQNLSLKSEKLDEISSLMPFDVTFMQILQVLEFSSFKKVPFLSDKLQKLFSNEKIANEFKNAKSLIDIISLTKKYDLKLDKITLSEENLNTLKHNFPKLDEKHFFKIPKNTILSENILHQKSLHVNKKNTIINSTHVISHAKEEKNDTKPLLFMLLNDDKKVVKIEKSIKTEKAINISQDIDENNQIKVAKNTQNEPLQVDEIVDVKTKKVQNEINIKTKINTNQEKQNISHQNLQNEKIEPKQIFDELKNEKIQSQNKVDNEIKTNPKQPLNENKISHAKANEPILQNEPVKQTQNASQNILQSTLQNSKNEQIISQNLQTNQNSLPQKNISLQTVMRNTEQFISNLGTSNQELAKHQTQNVKNVFLNENLMQNIQTNNSQNDNQLQVDEQSELHVNKSDSFQPNISKLKNQSLHVKQDDIKHTLNTFAQDFKEKVQSYKPPLMKIQMALSPKSLGDMEVTILNRGNNLHVNITSNTNAMNIFVQNQMEFKNSLVNMGFTNLEMNFSDQKKQNKNQQNDKNDKNKNDQDEPSEKSILELTLPQYI